MLPLVEAVQQALFGREPAELGSGLSGGHAVVWREIARQVNIGGTE